MSILIPILQGLYTIGALGLALYGLHAIWLVLELWLRRPVEHETGAVEWPSVTVQLPIYNERHVVERLVAAAAMLDYPRARLQVQLLDDSDDSTRALSERAVAEWQRRGSNIELVRRPDRAGYKAGALAHALPLAAGDYIAIFDADFLPPPDFLQRAMAVFAAGGPQVAFVQARWEHLNRDYSILTSAQALALDGHFGVEQPARRAAGYAFGFNGSAGVWRRSAIEDPAVGGWQVDTLCEDLDLAYRAQLAGWRGEFVGAISAPAEVPPQLLAFKRQQFRWAKGSVQTLRKLAGRVLRSGWSLPKKAAGLLHLGNYLIHPLLLLLLLVALPLLALDAQPPTLPVAVSLASLGPPFLYTVAQRRLHPDSWARNLAVLPVLTLFGLGLCFSNSIAVAQGLRHKGGSFARTPKFDIHTRSGSWRTSSYRLRISRQTAGEALLGLYAVVGTAAGFARGQWLLGLFLGLFAFSFLTMTAVELGQARQGRGRGARVPEATSPAFQTPQAPGQPVNVRAGQDSFAGRD